MMTITDQFGSEVTYSLLIADTIQIKVQHSEDGDDVQCYPVGAVLSCLEEAIAESGIDSLNDFRTHPELQEWLAEALMVQTALRAGARVRYPKGITRKSTLDYLESLITILLTALPECPH